MLIESADIVRFVRTVYTRTHVSTARSIDLRCYSNVTFRHSRMTIAISNQPNETPKKHHVRVSFQMTSSLVIQITIPARKFILSCSSISVSHNMHQTTKRRCVTIKITTRCNCETRREKEESKRKNRTERGKKKEKKNDRKEEEEEEKESPRAKKNYAFTIELATVRAKREKEEEKGRETKRQAYERSEEKERE